MERNITIILLLLIILFGSSYLYLSIYGGKSSVTIDADPQINVTKALPPGTTGLSRRIFGVVLSHNIEGYADNANPTTFIEHMGMGLLTNLMIPRRPGAAPDERRRMIFAYDGIGIRAQLLAQEQGQFQFAYRLGFQYRDAQNNVQTYVRQVSFLEIRQGFEDAVAAWAAVQNSVVDIESMDISGIDASPDSNVYMRLGTSAAFNTIDRNYNEHQASVNDYAIARHITAARPGMDHIGAVGGAIMLTQLDAGVFQGEHANVRQTESGNRYMLIDHIFPNPRALELLIGPIGNRDLRYVFGLIFQYQIGLLLGFDEAPSLVPSEISVEIPEGATSYALYDPMVRSFSHRMLDNYHGYDFIAHGLPAIPHTYGTVIDDLFFNLVNDELEPFSSADEGYCENVQLYWSSALRNKVDELTSADILKSMCRNVQVTADTLFNHRFRNEELKFYTKDSKGKPRNVVRFANMSSSDIIGDYYKTTRYYFPYGYHRFYISVAGIESEFYIGNVPKADNFSIMLSYDETKPLLKDKIVSLIRVDQSHLRNNSKGVLLDHPSIIGNYDFPLGVDFSFSINKNGYTLSQNRLPREIKVFVKYMTYNMPGEAHNAYRERGGFKIAHCNDDAWNAHFTNTGECIISLPRMFFPVGTHNIIIYVKARYGSSWMTYKIPHDLSKVIGVGGHGLQLPGEENTGSVSVGVLKYNSAGVMQYQIYSNPYPARENLTMFCDWPACPFSLYDFED